jgi:DNA-binding cell septation regulator SpoVG
MGTLEVTDFRNIRLLNVGKLRAFVDVVFNDALVVKGFKVIEGSNGLFVAAPARQTKGQDGKPDQWNDVVYLTKESSKRDEIYGKILGHYKSSISTAGSADDI